MAGVNRVILVGRLGHDPEVKYLPNGNAVVNFTMATSESWVKDGERQEKTEWHRIVAFGKLAEIIVKYLHKGKEVYIEGKLQTRSWEQDGVKRYTTEIVANQMQMLGSKESNGEQQAAPQPQQNHNQAKASGYQPQPQQQAFPQELPAGDGDIPF